MKITQKELINKYILGELTEVQFNYIISCNNWSRDEIDKKISKIKNIPAIMMLIVLMTMFVAATIIEFLF